MLDEPLSEREREVLQLLADGHSPAQTADRLFLSHHTIKTYLTRSRRKLGARNTAHAVAVALRRRLIQ